MTVEAAASNQTVVLTRERDGVALIHLNRPPANSYEKSVLDGLNSAIDEAEKL